MILMKMCINWDFYLDVVCSFLLNVYETFSSGCGKHAELDTTLTKEQKKRKLDERLNKLKVRVLLVRVGLGYMVNIGGFLVVCVTNRDTSSEGSIAFFLFCAIIIFAVCFYALITFILVYRIYSHRKSFLPDNRSEGFMMIYRFLEIIFDVLVVLYSFILSEWEMTEFTIATTTLSCSDILLNCLMLAKNCCDYHNTLNNDESADIEDIQDIEIDEKTSTIKNENDCKDDKPLNPLNLDANRFDVGTISVTLTRGDITTKKVDVIIITCRHDLELDKGILSRQVLAAAGNELQLACSKKDFLNAGEIVSFQGYKLPCKQIYLGYVPQWNGSPQIMETFITKCLEKADMEKMESVALPTLGSGSLKFPTDVMANTLTAVIIKFVKKASSVKEIYVVVYDDGKNSETEETALKRELQTHLDNNIQTVKEETSYKRLKHQDLDAEKAKKSQNSSKPSNDPGKYTNNSGIKKRLTKKFHKHSKRKRANDAVDNKEDETFIKVEIVNGEIFSKEVDVIVAEVPLDMKLKGGRFFKHMFQNNDKFGTELQSQCDKMHANGIACGQFVSINAPNNDIIKCFEFYLGSFPNYGHANNCEKLLKKFVSKCLKKSYKKSYNSIAFPTFGNKHNCEYPIHVVAEIMKECIDEFRSQHIGSSRTEDFCVTIFAEDKAQENQLKKIFK